MAKKNKAPKQRNYVALAAWNQSGAGRHKDNKKEASKKACRVKVTADQGGSFFGPLFRLFAAFSACLILSGCWLLEEPGCKEVCPYHVTCYSGGTVIWKGAADQVRMYSDNSTVVITPSSGIIKFHNTACKAEKIDDCKKVCQ